MTAEYSAFSRPALTAADFERADAETVSDSPMFAPPIYGRDPAVRTTRRGVSPAAWVAVPVIALALGAGVYALNRPVANHSGVAQLTPGVPAASTTMQPASVETARTDPAASNPAPSRMAAETSKAPAPVRTAEASPRVAAHVTATRHASVRSSASTAPSAMDTGQNASASAPAAPAPAPVVIAPPAPVVSAAPQPAPQAAPETPPTAPQVS